MISLDVERGVVDDREEDYCGSDEGAGAGSGVAREGDGSDALLGVGTEFRYSATESGVSSAHPGSVPLRTELPEEFEPRRTQEFFFPGPPSVPLRTEVQRRSGLDTERPPHLARARRRSGFEGRREGVGRRGAGPGLDHQRRSG